MMMTRRRKSSEELKGRVDMGGKGEMGRGGEGRETKYKKVNRDKVERPKHIKKDTRGTGMRMIGSGKKKGMG
jgi:hypothetical protein